jgi:nucleoside-diphosphate-sugar epimerase
LIRKSRNYTALTGATGLVGGHLLVELLRSQLPVVVLVRQGRRQSAADRVEAVLQAHEERLRQILPRPVVLTADLTKPGLGIPIDQREWVTANCIRIVHCAAHLSFRSAATHQHNEPFRTNIEGTRRLIEFCQQTQIQEFHHVSTAYVCGRQSGTRREVSASLDVEFCNDYEQSKAAAEQLLHQSSVLNSLTVYRPSIVADVSGPGAPDQPIQHAYSAYRLLRQAGGVVGQAELHASMGLTGRESKNIIRADWLARALGHIIRRQSLHGRIYHMTTGYSTSVADLTSAFSQVYEQNEKKKTRTAIQRPLRPVTVDTSVQEFTQAFGPYFREDPRFGRSNLLEALKACGLDECPPLTAGDLRFVAAQTTRPRAASNMIEADRLAGVTALRGMETNAAVVHNDSGVFELELRGPQGGSWTIWPPGPGEVLVSLGASGLERRVSLTTSMFESLVRGNLTAADSERCGALMEFNEEQGDSSRLIRDLQQLADAIRKLSEKHDSGVDSELSHVE